MYMFIFMTTWIDTCIGECVRSNINSHPRNQDVDSDMYIELVKLFFLNPDVDQKLHHKKKSAPVFPPDQLPTGRKNK